MSVMFRMRFFVHLLVDTAIHSAFRPTIHPNPAILLILTGGNGQDKTRGVPRRRHTHGAGSGDGRRSAAERKLQQTSGAFGYERRAGVGSSFGIGGGIRSIFWWNEKRLTIVAWPGRCSCAGG